MIRSFNIDSHFVFRVLVLGESFTETLALICLLTDRTSEGAALYSSEVVLSLFSEHNVIFSFRKFTYLMSHLSQSTLDNLERKGIISSFMKTLLFLLSGPLYLA